ncbi:hypothetical protein CKA34_02320 [Rhizobium sp. 11515TR]|nr:hypothetical protein CKA34_02320 [Rhizobium sp. 11515TR]
MVWSLIQSYFPVDTGFQNEDKAIAPVGERSVAKTLPADIIGLWLPLASSFAKPPHERMPKAMQMMAQRRRQRPEYFPGASISKISNDPTPIRHHAIRI